MSVLDSDKTTLTPRAVKRLSKDLKQLIDEPLIGANSAPVNDNLQVWCSNVVVVDGSYKDTILHFTLEFPSDYPQKPPHAYFETEINYFGGAEVRDAKGRQSVCLDLFGNFGKIHSEWGEDRQASGWTPAYSVRSILLNVQAVLADKYLSSDPVHVNHTKKSAATMKCSSCGHTAINPNPIILTDITEIKETIKIRKPEDNILCYSSGASFREQPLGYGISVDNKTLKTQAELLSKDAFDSGIRRSSTNTHNFSHWLPCYINPEIWVKVQPLFRTSIKDIYAGTKKPEQSEINKSFHILSSLMNEMVVEVMNQDKDLSASDRFIDGYFNCLRILKQLAAEDKSLIKTCNQNVESFLKGKNSKNDIPNMGSWLINLLVSDKYSWKDVGLEVVKETDARNVLWYMVHGQRGMPAKHPELLNPLEKRCKKVFDATSVSRTLICFQKHFITLAEVIDFESLDDNCGIVSDDMKHLIKDLHKTVQSINDWNDFFKWLELEVITEEDREAQLVDAMKRSESRGYHKAKTSHKDTRYPKYRSRYT